MLFEGDTGTRTLRSVPLPPAAAAPRPDPVDDPDLRLTRGEYLVTAFRPGGSIDYYAVPDAGYAARLATDLADDVGPAGIKVHRVVDEVRFDVVPRWEVHVTGGRTVGAR